MRNHLRTAVLAAVTGCSSWVSVSAQTTAAAAIRCTQCSLSGQKANTSAADFSQIKIIEQLKPVFDDGLTVQGEMIARVLNVSPFVVEVLDGRMQLFDRNMKPVPSGPDEEGACSVTRIEAVDRASRSILASLRLNDLITGRIVFQEDAQFPGALLGAQQVYAGIRRVTTPIRYFHASPGASCSNRSGRLLEYRSFLFDSVTVYNDGAIDYRDTLQRHFDREKLSDQELSELLQAFALVNFDTLPVDLESPGSGGPPGITLVAARYQNVRLTGNEARLAPLVSRLKAVVARATSRTSFLLKAGTRQTLTIVPWPYARVASLADYLTVRDTARRRRDSGETPPGGPLEERLPDEFLNRLPGTPQMPERDSDPNRFLYFSEGDALYRVMRNPRCSGEDWYCKSFYSLYVEKIETIETRLRAQAGRTNVTPPPGTPAGVLTTVDPARLADYNIYLGGGADVYLWTSDMVSTLAALAPAGATLSPEEYERHKALYRAILERRDTGIDLIERGVVFRVRLCQMEKGVVDDCAVR